MFSSLHEAVKQGEKLPTDLFATSSRCEFFVLGMMMILKLTISDSLGERIEFSCKVTRGLHKSQYRGPRTPYQAKQQRRNWLADQQVT